MARRLIESAGSDYLTYIIGVIRKNGSVEFTTVFEDDSIVDRRIDRINKIIHGVKNPSYVRTVVNDDVLEMILNEFDTDDVDTYRNLHDAIRNGFDDHAADIIMLYDESDDTWVEEYYDDDEMYAYESCRPKKKSKQRPRKRGIKESSTRSMNIDMWYGDPIRRGYYGADAYFNDLSATYSGNIYDPETGEIVGDYTCDDSTEIEKMFKIKWD